jgi:cellulase/cellobiase CelA1
VVWASRTSRECERAWRRRCQWPAGFVAQVVVNNTGTATISSWQVTVTLPGATFEQGWSATFTVSGDTIIIDPEQWNATIAPGASSYPVGLIASGDPAPSGISVTTIASGSSTSRATRT